MRIKLSQLDRTKLFQALKKLDLDSQDIAKSLKVSDRTIRDWKKGRFSIPEVAFLKLLEMSARDRVEFSIQILPDYWQIPKAAKMGGRKRYELHGDFATAEGRKRGGLGAVISNQLRNNNFLSRKTIKHPVYSERLAEFMGIMAGDGHLARYQVLMSTHSQTDYAHACFVAKLGEELFGIKAKITNRKDENTTTVVFSSRTMSESIERLGMPAGNKLKNGLSIPDWILTSNDYKKAYIRGLFDTDGCIFLDKHAVKHKIYAHTGWMITSASIDFRKQIVLVLNQLGYHPTCQPTQMSVFLRRQKEVWRYFHEIGSSNDKHLKRFQEFKFKN